MADHWDVDKYREEHESEEQWELRREFMIRWKDDYSEERLVCLARVFTNIEFMGCRYPAEVMQEVSRLSGDVAKQYRSIKKTKLQRTFVSASDAAVDRARGVKREGGVIVDTPPKKSSKIAFVPQSGSNNVKRVDKSREEQDEQEVERLLQRMRKSVPYPSDVTDEKKPNNQEDTNTANNNTEDDDVIIINDDIVRNSCRNRFGFDYIKEMLEVKCLDVRDFNDSMFDTEFGRFVLVMRLWTDIPTNILSTCKACNAELKQEWKDGTFTLTLDGFPLAQANGDKITSKALAFRFAWDKLRRNTISLVMKEQWVSQSETRISMNDMSKKKCEFGEPIEDSVALKMMKLMGWKGGGLGPDSQGISEPIKPNLRLVRRAGLGHETTNGTVQLRRAGLQLMRRRGIALDADLVFAADFTSEERAVLHRCAQQCGLNSRSYGKGANRFLVVTNKLKPFDLVRAVAEAGGETAKYRIFIPDTMRSKH